MAKNDWIIICGDYINALSIYQSAKKISWDGKIVFITINQSNPMLVDFVQDALIWKIKLENPDELFQQISLRIPEKERKFIFFTNELFHSSLHLNKNPRSNFYFWSGDVNKMDLILDRFLFYEFIKQKGIFLVPMTIESNKNPWDYFSPPFFLRIRKSWSGLIRRKGVIIIKNKNQLRDVEVDLINSGISREEWCYQEILSLDSKHNISICGWHQADTQRYFATQKILQHPGKMGNGDIVGRIDDPKILLNATQKLLFDLNYSGPFELEFVYDPRIEQYKIIELNPRFWMQHGLIEKITGNELIKRYLNQFDDKNSAYENETKYWINSFYLIIRFLKFDLRIMKYIFNTKKYISPPINFLFPLIYVYIRNILFEMKKRNQ